MCQRLGCGGNVILRFVALPRTGGSQLDAGTSAVKPSSTKCHDGVDGVVGQIPLAVALVNPLLGVLVHSTAGVGLQRHRRSAVLRYGYRGWGCHRPPTSPSALRGTPSWCHGAILVITTPRSGAHQPWGTGARLMKEAVRSQRVPWIGKGTGRGKGDRDRALR